MPRAATTWNCVDLATACHSFLASGETDWQAYQWRNQRIWRMFGDGGPAFVDEGLRYHAEHPGEPIRVWWAPPFTRGNALGMRYDPRFGDAFSTGSWNADWDETATLASISVPTTLVHTRVAYDDEGILMAAMGEEEAARTRELIPGVIFEKVETGHEFHEEDRAGFIRMLDELAERVG